MMVGEKLQKWHAVDIDVLPEAVEAVEHAFNMLDTLGIEIDDMPQSRDKNVKVTGYFNEPPTSDAMDAELEAALGIYALTRSSVASIAVREVISTDWLAEWKKHWKPTVVGKFVIAPPWENVETEKIVITIEPNMAFGTGTHETTQLCLQAITDNYQIGQTFLDVGTGTGILAIAAAKLGADNILVCDTDPDSIKIAKENAAANGVGEYVEFINGPLPDDTPVFDFVCANLTIDVIVPILTLLLAKTREKLVLSGILVEQQGIIDAELKKFEISDLKFEISGEWIAVIISKG